MVEVALLLDAELLARLTAMCIQVLVDARVPQVVGQQVRPGPKHQVKHAALNRA